MSVLTRMHDELTNVVVVHLRRNFGKAAALQAGFLEARGDVVVTIDADLQDDPTEIPKLLAKLDEGFDLVSGWKTRRNDPFFRRLFSKVFNWATGAVSGREAPRRELRPEGLPRRGAAGHSTVRRAPPVHSDPRCVSRFPDRRDPCQSPSPSARQLALRARALSPRLLRSPERDVHGSLPAPSAAPVRRSRAPHGCRRLRHPPVPHGHLVLGRGHRHATAAHARCAARRRRNPVRLARPDLGARSPRSTRSEWTSGSESSRSSKRCSADVRSHAPLLPTSSARTGNATDKYGSTSPATRQAPRSASSARSIDADRLDASQFDPRRRVRRRPRDRASLAIDPCHDGRCRSRRRCPSRSSGGCARKGSCRSMRPPPTIFRSTMHRSIAYVRSRCSSISSVHVTRLRR